MGAASSPATGATITSPQLIVVHRSAPISLKEFPMI
jgi:hypothetical protein